MYLGFRLNSSWLCLVTKSFKDGVQGSIFLSIQTNRNSLQFFLRCLSVCITDDVATTFQWVLIHCTQFRHELELYSICSGLLIADTCQGCINEFLRCLLCLGCLFLDTFLNSINGFLRNRTILNLLCQTNDHTRQSISSSTQRRILQQPIPSSLVQFLGYSIQLIEASGSGIVVVDTGCGNTVGNPRVKRVNRCRQHRHSRLYQITFLRTYTVGTTLGLYFSQVHAVITQGSIFLGHTQTIGKIAFPLRQPGMHDREEPLQLIMNLFLLILGQIKEWHRVLTLGDRNLSCIHQLL